MDTPIPPSTHNSGLGVSNGDIRKIIFKIKLRKKGKLNEQY